MKCLPLCILSIVLAGCGDDPPSTAGKPAPDKHPETKKLEAAEGVGYDGQGLKRTVDRMLDKREEQDKAREESRKAAGGETEKSE